MENCKPWPAGDKKTRSYKMKKTARKTLTKKKHPPKDKEFFAKFKGVLKGDGNLLKELRKEKKWEIEHDEKRMNS